MSGLVFLTPQSTGVVPGGVWPGRPTCGGVWGLQLTYVYLGAETDAPFVRAMAALNATVSAMVATDDGGPRDPPSRVVAPSEIAPVRGEIRGFSAARRVSSDRSARPLYARRRAPTHGDVRTAAHGCGRLRKAASKPYERTTSLVGRVW